MITKEYIDTFKKTAPFNIISKGLLEGDIENVLLGRTDYRITSQYEMEDTIPSQVLICIHILIKEGELLSDSVNEVFMKISITSKVICLLLQYLNAYIIYRRDHDELKLDCTTLLDQIKRNEREYYQYPCYKNLMASIESNMRKNQS